MNEVVIDLKINKYNDPDFQLVIEAKKGSDEAFNQLVKKYSNNVFNLCIKILNDYGEAEDLSQEIFLKVYKNLKKFKGKSKFSTWLYQITYNTSLNKLSYLKKRKHYTKQSIDSFQYSKENDETETLLIPDDETDIEKTALGKETYKIIMNEINNLPDEFKFAIIFRDIDQLSYQEISKLLKIPEGTVKSRIHRGREILKEKLSFLYNGELNEA